MNPLHSIRIALIALGTLMIVIAISALGACSDPDASGDVDGTDARLPYQIVTTTGMITDITKRVAGEHAQVVGLINSGVDPHLFQPTREDIARLTQADVVFHNGLHLEGKLESVFERIAQSSTIVVAVTDEIDKAVLLAPSEYEGNPDPHVWMDPILWCAAVDEIARTLGTYDSLHYQDYMDNAQALIDEIHELHAMAQQAVDSIPEGRRVLVTAHDAFSYFGQRYGFEVVGIQGISTESEAGVRDIERIVELLVDRQIGAVFVETTVSDRNIRALIAGAASKGHEVTIGGSLFSDAMGTPGTYEGTYLGMIDHNMTLISRALGGEAPERGFFGTLSSEEP